jgi:hypothetical protein
MTILMVWASSRIFLLSTISMSKCFTHYGNGANLVYLYSSPPNILEEPNGETGLLDDIQSEKLRLRLQFPTMLKWRCSYSKPGLRNNKARATGRLIHLHVR